jgi:hypothetical protein
MSATTPRERRGGLVGSSAGVQPDIVQHTAGQDRPPGRAWHGAGALCCCAGHPPASVSAYLKAHLGRLTTIEPRCSLCALVDRKVLGAGVVEQSRRSSWAGARRAGGRVTRRRGELLTGAASGQRTATGGQRWAGARFHPSSRGKARWSYTEGEGSSWETLRSGYLFLGELSHYVR